MDKRILKAETIIFDIGMVLIDFNIDYIATKMLPKRLIKYTKEQLFKNLWQQLDEGTITSKQSATILCKEFNIQGNEKQFQNIMDNFCEFCPPLPLASKIRELKALNKKIYLLTNYGDVSFKNSKKHYDFLKLVDGEVVSSVVKAVKPDKDIYQILLNKYNINPSTSVYIDDRLENIITGRKFNIDSIWYPKEYKTN